ncbi:MAG: hypothetical protein WC823_00930 [Parcubacteria group bacterium]|jgi:predicted RNA-binding protein with PUA domain
MKIIICGSMTAAKRMVEIEAGLKELGHEVILPRFALEYAQMSSMEEMHSESVKNKMDHDLIRDYFEEIKQGDAVLIINDERKDIANYIGGNSFLEMAFAHVLHKEVFLLNPIPEMGYSDELIAMQPVILNGDLNLIK